MSHPNESANNFCGHKLLIKCIRIRTYGWISENYELIYTKY